MKKILLFLLLLNISIMPRGCYDPFMGSAFSAGRGMQVDYFLVGFVDTVTGEPVSNGYVETYAAGTSTLKTLYNDWNLVTHSSNPITLNAAGRDNSAGTVRYAKGTYKFKVYDSDSTLLYTWDNLQFFNSPDVSGDEVLALDYGGVTNDTTFDSAISSNVDTTTIIISNDSTNSVWTIGNNLSVPARHTIEVQRGAILKPSTGKTLTFARSSQIKAGDYQIFDWVGTGNIIFTIMDVPVKSIWWGNTQTGSTLSKCDGSGSNGTIIINDTVTVTSNLTFNTTNTVLMENNGVFNIDTTYTVTINKFISEGENTRFIGNGLVSLTGTQLIKLDWWGKPFTSSKLLKSQNSIPKGTIYINDTCTISSTFTTDESITLELGINAYFTGSDTMTINGNFICGKENYFDTSLNIYFGNTSISEFRPEWWGAKGDDINNDLSPINKCLSVTDDRTMLLDSRTYKIITDTTNSIQGGWRGIIIKGTSRLKTHIHNSGTGSAFKIPTGVRGYTIQDLKITGDTGSLDAIYFLGDFGEVRFINLSIDPIRYGINTYLGNGTFLYLENIRVLGGQGCFNFGCNTTVNTITCINCYANGSSGIGYDVNTVSSFNAIGCSADNNTGSGFRLGTNASLTGCTAESNTDSGFNIVGSGSFSLIDCYTYGQKDPFKVNANGANVIFINPRTNSTSSGYSITLTNVGDINILGGYSNLDQGISDMSKVDFLTYDSKTYLTTDTSHVVNMSGLRTDTTGLVTGDIWCDTTAGRVLKIK